MYYYLIGILAAFMCDLSSEELELLGPIRRDRLSPVRMIGAEP